MVFSPFQQASCHPEVAEDLRSKALQYGSECTIGYISLLEQVLQVRMRHVSHEYRMEVTCICTCICV